MGTGSTIRAQLWGCRKALGGRKIERKEMKTIEEFEKEVETAVIEAKLQGWTIVHGTFYDPENKTCCPIGAILIARGLYFYEEGVDWVGTIEEEYGQDNIQAFWVYFDAKDADAHTEYGHLAKALRKELCP